MDTSPRVRTEATFSDLEMTCTIEIKSRNGTRLDNKGVCNALAGFTKQVLRQAREVLIQKEVLFNDANEVMNEDEAVGMSSNDLPRFHTKCHAVVSADAERERGVIKVLTDYKGSIDRLHIFRHVTCGYLKQRTLAKYGAQSQAEEFKVQVGGADVSEDDTLDKVGEPENTCFCIVPV